MKRKMAVIFLTLLIFSLAHVYLWADGSVLYKQTCYTCHDVGLVNAPRLGDKMAWKLRIPKGVTVLSQTVISGKGAMPPRGGSQLSDSEIKQVIQFMLSKVK